MSIRRTRSLNHLRFVVPAGIAFAVAGTAIAGGAFDGTYKGSQTVVRNNNYQLCTSRNDIVLIIQNNRFTRLWANTPVSVDVAGDGTFSNTASYDMGRSRKATVTITGKIAAASLEADMASDRCALHLSLKKS